jgi:nucleoside 2-deoxyribosyltransferase
MEVMMLIYLGGPIDSVTRTTASGWRLEAKMILSQYGLMAFDPTLPYCEARSHEAKTAIMTANRAVMSVASGGLFFINGQAFGTIREIEYMKNIGKTVVVASEIDIAKHIEVTDLILVSNIIDGCRSLVDRMTQVGPSGKISAPSMLPQETVEEYHTRKTNEVGVNRPYICDHPLTQEQKYEVFLKGLLLYQRSTNGVESIDIPTEYWGKSLQSKMTHVFVQTIEEITTASLVAQHASDAG